MDALAQAVGPVYQRIADSEKMQAGHTYRVTYQIRAPFNALTVGIIEGAIRVGNTINNVDDVLQLHQTVNIEDIEAFQQAAPLADGRNAPWNLRVTYSPKNIPEGQVSQAGVGDVLALISAILLALAFLGVVVGHYSEKLVPVLNAAGDAAKKALNPFAVVAVAALGILVLTTMRR